MIIERTCPRCKTTAGVRVSYVRNCIRKNILSGLCFPCGQWRGGGNVNLKGQDSPFWRGGRRQNRQGYILVYCYGHPYANDNCVLEHRLIMEKIIGRYLLPTETVHHKNGVRDDNRPENLELWAKSHGDGSRYEDLDTPALEGLIEYLQVLLRGRG